MTARTHAEAFLRLHRIAVVGVSRKSRSFSRMLFREFLKREYDAVPVNPAARDIEDRPCFARVQEIDPPVEGVLIMTTGDAIKTVLADCAAADVKRVWIYGILGPSRIPEDTIRYCDEQSLTVVPGYCPFMFFPEAGWMHRAHAWMARRMDKELR